MRPQGVPWQEFDVFTKLERGLMRVNLPVKAIRHDLTDRHVPAPRAGERTHGRYLSLLSEGRLSLQKDVHRRAPRGTLSVIGL